MYRGAAARAFNPKIKTDKFYVSTNKLDNLIMQIIQRLQYVYSNVIRK